MPWSDGQLSKEASARVVVVSPVKLRGGASWDYHEKGRCGRHGAPCAPAECAHRMRGRGDLRGHWRRLGVIASWWPRCVVSSGCSVRVAGQQAGSIAVLSAPPYAARGSDILFLARIGYDKSSDIGCASMRHKDRHEYSHGHWVRLLDL